MPSENNELHFVKLVYLLPPVKQEIFLEKLLSIPFFLKPFHDSSIEDCVKTWCQEEPPFFKYKLLLEIILSVQQALQSADKDDKKLREVFDKIKEAIKKGTIHPKTLRLVQKFLENCVSEGDNIPPYCYDTFQSLNKLIAQACNTVPRLASLCVNSLFLNKFVPAIKEDKLTGKELSEGYQEFGKEVEGKIYKKAVVTPNENSITITAEGKNPMNIQIGTGYLSFLYNGISDTAYKKRIESSIGPLTNFFLSEKGITGELRDSLKEQITDSAIVSEQKSLGMKKQ